MKCQRGINQCNVASEKIIEVRSNGMKVRSNGRKVRSNGMEVRSNGRYDPMEWKYDPMEDRFDPIGMEVRSNGNAPPYTCFATEIEAPEEETVPNSFRSFLFENRRGPQN